MKILPTMQDKWVSLHHSFGIICWCDDEQLGNEFKNLNNVEFLCFGELTTREKQMLQDNVSVLFRKLGIPSLSEVVSLTPTRSTYIWALRYALGNYLVHNLIYWSISVSLISRGSNIFFLALSETVKKFLKVYFWIIQCSSSFFFVKLDYYC